MSNFKDNRTLHTHQYQHPTRETPPPRVAPHNPSLHGLPRCLLLRADGLSGNSAQHAELELVSWKQVKDVTSDGGVIKKVIKESTDYKNATVEATVKVR